MILLPVRDVVVFPSMVVPLTFHDEYLVKVFDESMVTDSLIGFVGVKTGGVSHPSFKDLCEIGTAGKVLQYTREEKNRVKAVVEGRRRFRVRKYLFDEPYLCAEVELVREVNKSNVVTDALTQSINALFKVCLSLGAPLSDEVVRLVGNIESPNKLADLIASYLSSDLQEQQEILETIEPTERLKKVFLLLSREVQALQIKAKIHLEVAKEVGKTQKDFMLRQQMKVIQRELGGDDPHLDDLKDLRKKIKTSGMPEKIGEMAAKELARLERMSPSSAEYTVSRTYLDYLTSMPWNRTTDDNLDINAAETVLDTDHFGLEKVKERILEFLAVRKLRGTMKGPILCFVGPPGVGKTSLGMSIAHATGKKFIRVSLGGMRDEAEIRGHRRTYVGAMPGRIIQEIRRAEANNPVFMLDEVDKLGSDFRGDPASALLEVLDPEQNFAFKDHYLDTPFDLSNVLFVTTANALHTIPAPLRDRMEVVQISGYTEEEKVSIAERHLVPKQKKENGLEKTDLSFTGTAVRTIVRDYTREAGVRNLEREIASVFRKCAKLVTQGKKLPPVVDPATVEGFLGPKKYHQSDMDMRGKPGLACGLAWTEMGGEVIYIEATKMRGKSSLILTGSLGEVMKESAQAALSFIRSNAGNLGIPEDFYLDHDVHVHVPQGGIPKDGPSAGITILVALISLLKGVPVRPGVAMTGEITLSGELLPVGGIKEKILAALRYGITDVVIPKKNTSELAEIPAEQLASVNVILASDVQEALEYLLPVLSRRRVRAISDGVCEKGLDRATENG